VDVDVKAEMAMVVTVQAGRRCVPLVVHPPSGGIRCNGGGKAAWAWE
jgi:hypothetical protein